MRLGLYCDIGRNKPGAHIRIEGDISEICTDTSILLNNIYSELYRVEPILGNAFKYLVTRCVTEPESPTWVLLEQQEGDVRIAVQKPKASLEINNSQWRKINMIGKYVIVRSKSAGVFAGVLESREGQEVTLSNARRLWRWSGASECLQIAKEGVKNPSGCKFTVTVDSITILDTIEVIPATEAAEANIKAVPVWKM